MKLVLFILMFSIFLIPTASGLSIIDPETECCNRRVIELEEHGVTEFNCQEYLETPAGKNCIDEVRLSNEAVSGQINAAFLTTSIYYIVVILIALLLLVLLMDFVRRRDIPIRERKTNVLIWILFLMLLAYMIVMLFPA